MDQPTTSPPDWRGQNIPIHHPQPGRPGYWMIPLLECFLAFDEDSITDLLPGPREYGWNDEFLNEMAWVQNSHRTIYFIPDFNRYGCIPTWFGTTDPQGRELSPQGQVDRFLFLVDQTYSGLPQDHRQVNPRALAEGILELFENSAEYLWAEAGITWQLAQEAPNP